MSPAYEAGVLPIGPQGHTRARINRRYTRSRIFWSAAQESNLECPTGIEPVTPVGVSNHAPLLSGASEWI